MGKAQSTMGEDGGREESEKNLAVALEGGALDGEIIEITGEGKFGAKLYEVVEDSNRAQGGCFAQLLMKTVGLKKQKKIAFHHTARGRRERISQRRPARRRPSS